MQNSTDKSTSLDLHGLDDYKMILGPLGLNFYNRAQKIIWYTWAKNRNFVH